MDVKELGIPDPIIDTNPAFEIPAPVHTTRHHDVLGWAATGATVLMLAAWLFLSLVG